MVRGDLIDRDYDGGDDRPSSMEGDALLIRLAGVLALSTALIAATASAQDRADPEWIAKPDEAAMAEAYPTFAAMAGLDGDVTLRCGVAPDGVLSLCRVVTAGPTGLGFDRAGLSLASLFRASEARMGDAAITTSVQFTIRFRMGEDEAPLRWTDPEPTPEHLAVARRFVEQLESWKVGGDGETFETMNLDVDPDREARVRAILLASKAEFLEQEKQGGALMIARLLTPEQLADAMAGEGEPPVPSEDREIRASDAWLQMTVDSSQRLKQLYCAEFDCSGQAPEPRQTAAP